MAITIDEMEQRFIAVRRRAGTLGVLAASDAMADEGKAIVQTLLSKSGRAAPGMPPGLRSGRLRESITIRPAVMIGDNLAEATVSPHTVYARLLEYGGAVWPDTRRYMRIPAGYGHPVLYRRIAYISTHSYMRRMRNEGIGSGAFRNAASDAFMIASGLSDL